MSRIAPRLAIRISIFEQRGSMQQKEYFNVLKTRSIRKEADDLHLAS